jgi:sugar phosphate isomerase/epimerase
MMNMIGYRLDDQKIDGSLRNLDKELGLLKEIGINCVELPVHGLDVIKNGGIDFRVLAKIKEILKAHEFAYTVHCADSMNLMDEENMLDQLDLFISSLEFCRQINAKIFVYHAGRFVSEEEFIIPAEIDGKDRERLLEMERLYIKKEASKYADIKICMENARPYKGMLSYCYAEDMDTLAAQVRAINCPNVGITLDVGHLNMSAAINKSDPVQAISRAEEHLFHVHLHDNFGKTCYHHEKKQTHLIPLGKGDCHMPIGMGNAPIKNIIELIKAHYTGCFIFEYRSRYKEFLKESVDRLNFILE